MAGISTGLEARMPLPGQGAGETAGLPGDKGMQSLFETTLSGLMPAAEAPLPALTDAAKPLPSGATTASALTLANARAGGPLVSADTDDGAVASEGDDAPETGSAQPDSSLLNLLPLMAAPSAAPAASPVAATPASRGETVIEAATRAAPGQPGSLPDLADAASPDAARNTLPALSQAAAGEAAAAGPARTATPPARPMLPEIVTAASGDNAPPATTLTVVAAPGEGPRLAPAGQAPVALTQTPLQSPAWAHVASQRLAWMVQGGESSAVLAINPESLGPIHVRIQMDGQNARIDLAAQQPVTATLLESHLPRLTAALESQGVRIDELKVGNQALAGDFSGAQNPFSGQQAEAGGQGARQARWMASAGSVGDSRQRADEAAPVTPPRRSGGSVSQVDDFA